MVENCFLLITKTQNNTGFKKISKKKVVGVCAYWRVCKADGDLAAVMFFLILLQSFILLDLKNTLAQKQLN